MNKEKIKALFDIFLTIFQKLCVPTYVRSQNCWQIFHKTLSSWSIAVPAVCSYTGDLHDWVQRQQSAPRVAGAHRLPYVRRNWIDSELWPPSTWSVYIQPIKTNNDVEGWHNRLKGKAGHSKLNLYQLLQLLRNEATLGDVCTRMMMEGGTAWVLCNKYKKVNTFITECWEEHIVRTRSAASLLCTCLHTIKHMRPWHLRPELDLILRSAVVVITMWEEKKVSSYYQPINFFRV